MKIHQINIIVFAIIAFIFAFLEEHTLIYYLSLVYFMQYFIKFIKFKSFDIIYLAHVFISIYFIFGLMVFNIEEYRLFFLHNIQDSLFSDENLTKINFLYFISLLFLSFFYNPKKLTNNTRVSKYKETNNLYSKLVKYYSIIYLFVLVSSYYYLDGRYIWFIQETKGSMELKIIWQLISSGGLYLSALLPLIYINEPHNKNKFVYIIVLLSSFLLLKLGIRMYAVLILFSILLNMQARGFRYNGYKIYIYYIVFGLAILSFAMFRFKVFDFTNTMAIIESVTGEFIFPHSSAFYIITNPLFYEYFFINLQDLVLQIMPTSVAIEFKPILEEYTTFLYKNGIIAGYGGYFLLGQLYFYFGYLFFIPLLFISHYFQIMNSVLIKREKLYLMTIFPIFLLVLPRMQIWTFKALFWNLLFFLVFICFIKKIQKSRFIKNKEHRSK